MNAEIIAVGSELLLGQINNTNARFISNQLSELGIHIYHHTVVGDNKDRLLEAIRIAESRADLIIFSGGLGPTKDDLTKETIAAHLGVELEYDKIAMDSIESFFERRGVQMTDNNKKQALVIAGCDVLPNHHGLAPGMFYEANGRHYILLPGPPSELEPMFQYEAKPRLAALLTEGAQIMSHVLRFYGIGESALEVEVDDLLDNDNPTVAPLAGDGEVTLRITAKAHSEEAAKALIQPVEEEILSRVGKYCYGTNDDSLSSKLAFMLIDNGLTIAAAESLTAGMFMAELGKNGGIGMALQGGAVVYNEHMKVKQLGIDRAYLDKYTVVSKECAEAMAIAVAEKYEADIGVGLTGAAGPEAHDGSPAGTIWIGIKFREHVRSYELKLGNQRNLNRAITVKNAFYRIIRLLDECGYEKLKNND